MSEAMYELDSVAVDLSNRSGSRRILADITMSIAPGEVIGIVGRSGTGKTTLMRALAGLTPISEGSLKLQGKTVSGPPEGVVTIFQDYGNALLPWRTVSKNRLIRIQGVVGV